MLPKFLTVALAATLATAQTFTECDPTKKGEPPHSSWHRDLFWLTNRRDRMP